MTDQDKHKHQTQQFDAKLSALYAQRKETVRASSSMKRQALKSTRNSSSWYSSLYRLQHVAIAAGTLLLISLVALQLRTPYKQSPELVYTQVDVHSLESNKIFDYQHISDLYHRNKLDFQQRQTLLAQHHQKSAILVQLEDGWELRTCEQALVKISQELVKTLQGMSLVNASLKDGDSVKIAFNSTGLIVGIEPKPEVLQC